jgi:hypothetical protein
MMTWIAAIIAGLLFGQTLCFHEALKQLSEKMTLVSNVGVPSVNYQRGLTPPWYTKAFSFIVFVMLGALIAAGFHGGIFELAIAIVCFVAATVLSMAANTATSWPSKETYHRIVFHNLINREADYRKGGDLMWANATQHHQHLMISALGSHPFGLQASGPNHR